MKRMLFYLLLAILFTVTSKLVRRYVAVRTKEVLTGEIEWGTPLEEI